MEIANIISAIAEIPNDSMSRVLTGIKQVEYPKGHILLSTDRVEKTIFFVKKGMVRAYLQQGDRELTFWFGKEGDTVVSMKSYVEGKKGYENIELLENGELYALETSFLLALFDTDIHIANWGRRFAEKELLKTEERLISRQVKTAAERYQYLVQDHPALLQRVQLGHLASYLGITQVSLSRIRKEVKW